MFVYTEFEFNVFNAMAWRQLNHPVKCTLQISVRKKSGYIRMYVCTIKPLYDDDFENKMLSGADCNKF